MPGILDSIKEWLSALAPERIISDKPWADMLPYGHMVDATTVLLHEPPGLRKGRHPVPKRFALGRLWRIEQRNADAMEEAALLQLAQSLTSPLKEMPLGAIFEVRMTIRPAAAMPAWLERRAKVEHPAIDSFAAHIASGMHHDIGTRHSRMRDVKTFMGIRVPITVKHSIHEEKVRVHGWEEYTRFSELADIVERWYDKLGFKPQALGAEDWLALATQCLNPNEAPPLYDDEQPLRYSVVVPSPTLDVNRYTSGDEEAHVYTLHKAVGKTYPGMLSMIRKPDDLTMGADLWDLVQDHPLTVVVQMAVPNQQKLLASISGKRSMGTRQRTGTGGEDRVKIRTQMDDLEAFEERLSVGSDIGVEMGVHFILWGKRGEMGSKDGMLRASLRRLGMEAIPETLNANTMFLRTLPLGNDLGFPREGSHVRRMRRLPASNAAHYMPVLGTFRGYGNHTPGVMVLNERGEVVCFDPLADNDRPHFGVFGSNRSGKSFFMNFMASQLLPLGATFIFIDRHGSYKKTCELFDGRHIELNLREQICFGPFDGPLDQDHQSFLVNIMTEMCTMVTPYETSTLSHPQRVILGNMLQTWVKERQSDDTATLSEFYDYIATNPLGDHKELCERILILLSPFCHGGRFAGFIDGRNEVALKRGLWSFDLEPLHTESHLLAVLTTVLFSRVDIFIRQNRGLDHPIIFAVDEAHASLKSPQASQMIERCYREYARMYVAMCLLTQQMQDLKGWIGEVVRNNCGSLWSFAINPDEAQAFIDSCQFPPHMGKVIRSIGNHPKGGCSEGIVYLPGVSGSSDGEGGQFVVVGDPWFAGQIGQSRYHRELKGEGVVSA